MTDDELDRLQALADAATAGPWLIYITPKYKINMIMADGQNWESDHVCDDARDLRDAEFIAASRDAIPALIAEVRRLRSAMRETFVQGAIYERARTTACGPQPANGYLANLARCEAFRRWPDGEVSDD